MCKFLYVPLLILVTASFAVYTSCVIPRNRLLDLLYSSEFQVLASDTYTHCPVVNWAVFWMSCFWAPKSGYRFNSLLSELVSGFLVEKGGGGQSRRMCLGSYYLLRMCSQGCVTGPDGSGVLAIGAVLWVVWRWWLVLDNPSDNLCWFLFRQYLVVIFFTNST